LERPIGHPYDTPVSVGLRFSVEILAWIAGPWAVTELAFWLWPPTALLLIGLPAIFSTRGDKRQVLVPTPGPARALIEFLLHAVAIGGAWMAWPPLVAAPTTLLVAATLVTGFPRLLWLLRGAPIAASRVSPE